MHWLRSRLTAALTPALVVVLLSGCGTTHSRSATEQLLMSDAVDRAISQINFGPMAGQTVYLDSSYIAPVKSAGFVNSSYVISSLRQQLTAAGCLLQDDKKSAEIIVEPRVGTLGTDGHEITFGVPPSTAISSAASIVSNSPPIPLLPEISFAKNESQAGAAKVSVFAYYQDSKQPIWQSGTLVAHSTAKDFWFLGAGPLQWGTIHDGVRFAGNRMGFRNKKKLPTPRSKPEIEYDDELVFSRPRPLELIKNLPASFDSEEAEPKAAKKP